MALDEILILDDAVDLAIEPLQNRHGCPCRRHQNTDADDVVSRERFCDSRDLFQSGEPFA